MREKLKELDNTTCTFNATIDIIKREKIKGKYINVILFKHVKMDGISLANHCWQIQSNIDTKINKSMLQTHVNFVATVQTYIKNKKGLKVMDYCLTNIKVISIL